MYLHLLSMLNESFYSICIPRITILRSRRTHMSSDIVMIPEYPSLSWVTRLRHNTDLCILISSSSWSRLWYQDHVILNLLVRYDLRICNLDVQLFFFFLQGNDLMISVVHLKKTLSWKYCCSVWNERYHWFLILVIKSLRWKSCMIRVSYFFVWRKLSHRFSFFIETISPTWLETT